jgi:Helix-turn-helix domain
MMTETTQPLTLSVPEAGKRYFGLSREGSYDAARRGDIPTIKIGRLLRVPVRAVEQMLDRALPRISGAVK